VSPSPTRLWSCAEPKATIVAEEACLLALEKLLDHRLGPGFAEAPGEDLANRCFRLRAALGNRHPLARRQTVCLDHHRDSEAIKRGKAIGLLGDSHVIAGRNARPFAQVLGEALAALEPGGGTAGPEHRNRAVAQRIGQPIDQRRLRADDNQPDPVRLAESDHRGVVRRIERDQLGVLACSWISRRDIEPVVGLGEQAGLRQLPGQRMFAAARAQQQDIHGRFLFR
jgi:hypothetical protein